MKTITNTFMGLLLVFSANNYAQVGIGTDQPHESAALEIQSADKGLLLPRLTKNETVNITNPIQGLIVFCIDCEPASIYFYNGTSWINNINGEAMEVFHEASGTLVKDIVSPTGRTWMDRNLGADQAATSLDDYEAFGNFYQFGRDNDGHQVADWVSNTEVNFPPTSSTFNATVSSLSSLSDVFLRGSGIHSFWYSGSEFTINDF